MCVYLYVLASQVLGQWLEGPLPPYRVATRSVSFGAATIDCCVLSVVVEKDIKHLCVLCNNNNTWIHSGVFESLTLLICWILVAISFPRCT